MNICVFCSSSKNIDKKYFSIAEELINYFNNSEDTLIYGGTNVGTMGVIAEKALENNIRVISVIPKKIYNLGIAKSNVDKIFKTKTMHERKKIMEDLAEAFIALPGGFGTLEELLEVITLKQLGYHNKPIVIINAFNFYLPLLACFDMFYQENFTKKEFKNLYYIADSTKSAFDYLSSYREIDSIDKF